VEIVLSKSGALTVKSEHRGVGHNPPQESHGAFVQTIVGLDHFE